MRAPVRDTVHILAWSHRAGEQYARLVGLKPGEYKVHTADTADRTMRGISRGTKLYVLGPEEMYDWYDAAYLWPTLHARGFRMIPDNMDRLLGVNRNV